MSAPEGSNDELTLLPLPVMRLLHRAQLFPVPCHRLVASPHEFLHSPLVVRAQLLGQERHRHLAGALRVGHL